MRLGQKAGRGARPLTRVLAMLAVLPIGLGPSALAFAQEADVDVAETETPTTSPPVITAPPSTAPTVTVAAPDTTAPEPVVTDAPATTVEPESTVVEPGATTTPDASLPVETPPSSTTTEPDTSIPTTDTNEPSTGTTSSIPDASDGSPTTVAPAVDDPDSTTPAEPTATATETSPDSTAVETIAAETTVADTATTSSTLPKVETTTEPVSNIVTPPTTEWTIGLEVTGGWTYTGPFQFYLRNRFGGTTVALQDGETSASLSRGFGASYYVRVEMGSSYDPGFPFSWTCSGDVSGVSTGTTEQFTPNIAATDSTMDCVFTADNTNPPTVTVVTEVLGDPGGLVSFDTTVQYNFFGDHLIGTVSSVDGTTRTFDGVPEFRVDLASVATGSTPTNTQTSTNCVNAAGTRVGGSGLSAGWSNSEFGVGAAITCTITHTIPPTLTIVEDVVPDDPSAPGADYSRRTRVTVGGEPTSWTLSDGESQTFAMSTTYNGTAFFNREEVPGWDVTGIECNEILAGGATQPYTDYTVSLSSFRATANFPPMQPGIEVVCRYIAEPAGPPSLSLRLNTNVFDQSTLSDFTISVRDELDTVISNVTIASAGGTQTVPLTGFGINYTLQLADDQGREIAWACGAVTSNTNSITFPTVLGETSSCTLFASDPFPTGTGSLTILKNEEPDNYERYNVTVRIGDFAVGSDQIEDGGPGLFIPNLAPGVYAVTETGVNTSYELASVSCTVGTTSAITRMTGSDGQGDGGSFRTGNFTVDTSGSDVCTLVNSPSTTPSIVRIETVTVPGGAVESFDYSISPVSQLTSGTASFSQVDGDIGSRGVDLGFLEINQDLNAGFTTETGCGLTGSFFEIYDGGRAGVFVEPDFDYTCRFINTSVVATSATLEVVNEVTPDTIEAFGYGVGPAGVVTGQGPALFTLLDGESATRTTTAGSAITVTHASVVGYSSTSSCSDGVAEIATGDERVTYLPAADAAIVCTFNHQLIPVEFELAINVVVDTGAVDLAAGFDFTTEFSGPGVRFGASTGITQTRSLLDDGILEFDVIEATDVTIDVIDDDSGPDGFRTVIDCGLAAAPVTNVALTITMNSNVPCTITFTARTVTVLKTVGGQTIPGFGSFEFAVDPSLEYSGGTFFLDDGEEQAVVVPVDRSFDLFELDSGPYDVEIECTQQTANGPVFPYTGPNVFSDFIEITEPTLSYYCEVFNFYFGDPIHEVILETELDLGGLEVPDDLSGFFVDFDGDLFDENDRPDDTAKDPNPLPTSSLLDSVFVSPNGTVSVLVEDGADLDIAAGAGSGVYQNSISCPGASTRPDGTIGLTNITTATTCSLVSSAGSLTVRHSVVGPTSVTSWPFTITNVVAGPSTFSLGDGDEVAVAVAADAPVTITQTSAVGAASVESACLATGQVFRAPDGIASGSILEGIFATMLATSETVSVGGADGRVCSFITTYNAVTPTTTTPTTTAPPTTAPPTTVVPPVVPPTTTPPVAPATTTATPPTVPFAPTTRPPTTTPPASVPPTEPPPTEPPVVDDPPPTTPPVNEPPADDPPVPDPSVVNPSAGEPPAAITVTDVPEDVFVDIGDPIPVDVDCAGELVILVNGVQQDRVDQIEPSALGLGDHVITVQCDGEQITSVRAVVFEQEESAPGGRNMTVIVMFIVMASAAFLFAPSAATGRKRLPS